MGKGKWLLRVVAIIGILGIMVGGVPLAAATTQDVTVDATPEFISISNAPSTFDFGTVAAGVDENTGTDYFTITNSSTVATDIDIRAVTGWEGGANDWTYGASGEDQAKLAASAGTGLYTVDIAAVDTDYELIDNLGATTNDDWELKLIAPSSFTFPNAQQIVVRLTASAYD